MQWFQNMTGVLNKQILTQDKLERLNRESFGSSLDIVLVTIGSSTRAQDVPEIGPVQAKAQGLRDLKTELEKGIYNIPKEVLEMSSLNLENLQQDPDLIDKNQKVQDWIKKEIEEIPILLKQLAARKLDLKASILMRFLSRKVSKIAAKLLCP